MAITSAFTKELNNGGGPLPSEGDSQIGIISLSFSEQEIRNRQERGKAVFEIDDATNTQDLPQDPHRFFLHKKSEEDK
jgi:hypothetical protein